MGKQHLIKGIVKRHPDGFGFLIPEDPLQPDVYLPRHTMDGVMTNDTVLVSTQEERDGRFSGTIEKIITRAHTKVVGVFNKGYLRDTSHAWSADLRVMRSGREVNVKDGDMVAVRIANYPDHVLGFSGEIVDVLGDPANPLLDTKRMLFEHNVPQEFSKDALRELEGIADEPTEKDWAGRKDLRHLKFVTIDGVTARDFDDAVYAEKDKGSFRIWVAIADVSHYVRPNTALDRDAYERGTSVYFPDMVVPMLPEKISNGLCSLNPHKNRLAMVAEMLVNHNGEIIESKIYEAVFRSHHRLTYGIVQEVLDGKTIEEFEDVRSNLELMRDIAKILMKKRFQEGSLDLELPEVELLIDETGNPIDILRSERLFSHRLIEELMLLANVAVARFISKRGFPCLYRIHEEPSPEAIKTLEVMAHNWSVRAHFGEGKKLQKQIMDMLGKIKGSPQETVLHMLVLRSLKQARYSPDDTVGHFGLAFSDYTHFTSPIRRYPDLVVHRVLKRIIHGERVRDKEAELEKMTSMGVLLSACEQRANKAERDLATTKRCRFLINRVGEVFEGMVSGVTKFGFFVQLRNFDVDGLVKLAELNFDRFDFDEDHLRLVGRKSGFAINLGDKVKVQVMKVNVEARQIDFGLVEDEDRKNAPAQHRSPDRPDSEKRGTAAPNRSGFREAWLSQHRRKGKGRKVSPQKTDKKRGAGKSHRRRKG